jgi:hypothetical protein
MPKTRRARKLRRHTRRRRVNQRGGADYVIINILDTTPELRNEMEAHLQKCWPGTNPVRKAYTLATDSEYPTRIDLMYKRGDDGSLVFSRILHHFTEEKSLYIQETCVSESERGRGHYKHSLTAMRAHYPRSEFERIVNKVEYETAGGVDHSTRLLVFHKMGYRFQPVTRNPIEDPLYFKLKDSDTVAQYVRPIESSNHSSFTYVVKTRAEDEKTININDIDYCISPISLPKTVTIKKGNSTEVREGVKFLMSDGILTKNPETGVEEVTGWDQIDDVKWERQEGDVFDIANHNKIYCPLFMNL